jgi:hypothetical protein
MRTRLFAATLAVCIPSIVFAQKKGASGGSDPSAPAPMSSSSSSSATVKTPSGRDLQDLNPAALLVDKKKKASLPDSTVAQLKAAEKKINDRNAQFFATYDSVRKWTIPIGGSNSATQAAALHGGAGDSKLTGVGSSAAEQAQMQTSMRDLRKMMADYRDRHSADVADALAIVPDAQKKAATDLLNSQNGDLDKLIGKP